MAKRKNAVKSGLNQLRQALLDVKTAIIHFSDDHIVSIGYDPSSKATVVTDIPQNLSSQFVLGEESGGGSLLNKKISITVINNTGSLKMWESPYLIPESGYVTTGIVEIAGHSQIVQDVMIPMSDETYYFDLPKVNPGATVTASNLVNCTFEFSGGNQDLVVTDPTMDASVTLTYAIL